MSLNKRRRFKQIEGYASNAKGVLTEFLSNEVVWFSNGVEYSVPMGYI